MKHKATLPILAAVAMFFALAGCGSTAPSSPSSGTSTLTPGTAALNGCPTQHIPIDGSNGSTVVVTNGAQDQAVTVTVGQTVVVEMPAAWHWELDKQDSASILGDLEPEGYFNSAKSVCVWRFAAQTAGSAQLKYSGTKVCAPSQPCPAIAMVQQFTINVQQG